MTEERVGGGRREGKKMESGEEEGTRRERHGKGEDEKIESEEE